jgi:CheY-like chemotaxis protein
MGGAASKRVVIVDDNQDTRFLLRHIFERDGRFEVVGEAADGSLAPAAVRSHSPDIVLLDLHMPGVDGLTALPDVQAAASSDVAIVLMSVNPTPPDAFAGSGASFLLKAPGFADFVDQLIDLVTAPASEERRTADSASWNLPADPRSGGVARRHLRELLRGWQLTELLDEAELLATELVNNAVVHAHSEVVLAVQRRNDALHVAVSDTGEGVPHQPDAGLEATHGRGLMLVEAIARDWGAAINGSFKTLWFELALP